MEKIKRFLLRSSIVLIPIMSVFTFSNSFKMNMAISDFALLIFLIITLIDIRNFQLRREFPYWWVFGLLGIWMVISNVLAMSNPYINNIGWVGILGEGLKIGVSGLYFYMGYQSLKKREYFGQVLKDWSIGSVIVCIIGLIALVRYYQGSPLELHTLVSGSRSSAVFVGTLTDPNLAALYLSISFYIVLMWLQSNIQAYERGIALGTLILIPVCLLLTISRGGLIGFSISILAYLVLHVHIMNRRLLLVISLIGVLILGWLDVDATYMNGVLYHRFLGKMDQITEQTGEFIIRKNLSLSALQMGMDHIVLGVGRGNYPLNSAKHLKNLGIQNLAPYQINGEMKIPHNTLAGIFAELGLVGVLLYLWIFFVLIKQFWRKRKEKEHSVFIYLIIPLFIGIFVESIPLNIENFRGLWFLAGFLLAVEKSASYTKLVIPVVKKKRRRLLIFSSLILFILLGTLYIDAGRKVSVLKKIRLTSNQSLRIEVTEWESGEPYTIYYELSVESPRPEQKSAIVQVIETDKDGRIQIIDEYQYWKAKGMAKISFIPEEGTKDIFFQINSTENENTTVSIEDVGYMEGEVKKSLLRDYPLLSEPIHDWVRERKWLIGNESVVKKEQEPSLWGQKVSIQLGNSIFLQNVDYELIGNEHAKVKFIFQCTQIMDIDYIMWLHGIPDNINLLTEERIQYGSGNYDHLLTPETSSWEVGKQYIHEFFLPINKGSWEFEFGLWRNIDGQVHRLYIDGDQNEAGIYLGEIKFNEK